jgi:hypothetical protein
MKSLPTQIEVILEAMGGLMRRMHMHKHRMPLFGDKTIGRAQIEIPGYSQMRSQVSHGWRLFAVREHHENFNLSAADSFVAKKRHAVLMHVHSTHKATHGFQNDFNLCRQGFHTNYFSF